MDLSRRLRSTALILFTFLISVQLSHSRFPGTRQKRQYGANLYLPASSITPGGEGDPSEWTEWSSPSECSRSCGGGVSFQARECRRLAPNGAPLCEGGNRKYFSCNTQDCPEEEADFRAQQCSRFNHVPFDGVEYDWVPYTNAPNPCELNCMPVGERFYYRQKAKVIDGTRCSDKELDVCVDGQCQPVGCDMMLGSDAKEDKCRKCGGDGSTCKTISDTFTTTNLAAGYNDILLIPSGATNIRVQETAPSNNYLACRNLSSHYYLNGNWRIDFPRPMFYAGSWWNYQRKPTGFAAPDQLTCSGPTIESIYIVMLVQDKNVSIDYEYSIPESVSENTPHVYNWTHMEFGPCSASCGGGTQSRIVTCNNRNTLQEADSSLCDDHNKPSESQECGEEPCAPHWVEGEWNKCSKGCGADGMQNRTVTCERISPSGEKTTEEESVCLQLVGNKPANVQECNRDVKNCPKYHLGPWTPCDKLCGDGKQKRKVTCYIEENGRKKVLGDEECVEEKPETEKACMLAPCEGVDWIISQWSGCEACGQNTETRTAICGSKSGKVYPDEFCAPEVPLLSRSCKSKKCETQWFTSQWSKCSASCGKGVQSRIVLCGEFDGISVTPAVDDSKCDASAKPESEQECEGEEKECPGQWFSGPWGPCSKSCGGGERVREVLCLSNGTKSLNCDESKIEAISEKCNTNACTEDEVIPVDSTSKPIEDVDEAADDEDEECSDEDEDDDIEVVTGKMNEDLKISDGIDLDEESTTLSSLMTDELMLSDAPSSDETTAEDSSTDVSVSTVEGSGDSTDDTTMVTEGSGDDSDSTTEISSSTDSSTDSSSSTDQSISTDASSSTEVTGASDTTDTSDSTAATEVSETTDSSVSPGSTDSSGSTDASDTTDASASTDASGTTDASASTDATDTTDSSASTDSTDSSVSPGSTDASASTDASGTTDASASTDSTDITDSSASTDSSVSPGSTDSSAPTDTSDTTDSSEATSPSDSTEPSPTTDTSDSTDSSSSTDGSTESSTDSSLSTETSVSTESTTDSSSVSTESSTDSSDSTESSTDSSMSTTIDSESSTSSSDSTVVSSEANTESTTDASSISTDSSTDVSESSTDVTDTSGASTIASSDSTEVTTESGSSDTTDTTDSSDTTDVSGSSGTTEGVTKDTTDVSGSSGSTEGVTEDSSISTESGSTDSSTDETTIAGSDTTDVSDTTEITGSDVTTDSSTVFSTEGGSSQASTDVTSTDETTDTSDFDSTTDSSGSTDTSEFVSTDSTTESGSTDDSTTESGSTDDSTLEGSTDTSLSTDEDTTVDIWSTTDVTDDEMERSTPNTLEAAITKEAKKGKCKAKKSKKDCTKTEYGCCSDNKSVAKGPFDEGCPVAKTCAETKFGCCLDGVSPAEGKNHKGCPKSQCAETLFGCCPDKFTPAEGEDSEGCPEPTTLPPTTTTEMDTTEVTAESGVTTDLPESTETPTTEEVVKSCGFAEFGCCPDGTSEAQGKDFLGCTPLESSNACDSSAHGCCPDGRTAAAGPDGEGCASCTKEPFGCCPDNQTPAHGPLGEGCCLNSPYGCCPDNINSARGPNFEDCDCKYSPYGCCPDSKTAARGPSNEGCGCESSEFGCCPDKITPANGAKFEGCSCATMQFGCCPDGLTFAQGPHHYGCHCSQTEFKCCSDEKTPAKGPNEEGCTCLESKFGCCPDGATSAQGDKFEGCENVKEPPQKACGLPKETGTCGNFSIKYFFDTSYGACARFWYGGCDGNDNRFETEAECKGTCQDYTGKEACLLPKSAGPCTGYNKKWYFDADRNRCEEFNYGGCYGTNNRFDSLSDCQSLCTINESIPPCEQPMEQGPCEGNFERWFYDNQTDVCRPFTYGGCKGNSNNYPTEHGCNYHCRQPGVHKDFCSLPKQTGDCSEQQARWYYSDSDKKCMPFYYSGCGANKNNFPSQDSCEDHCPKQIAKDICEIPAEVGECTNYAMMFYYDTKDERCRQFYYGGCGGNENKFQTEEACLQRCEKKPEPKPEPKPEQENRPEPRPSQGTGNVCDDKPDPGNCANYVLQWYFDNSLGTCRQFYYGGCAGNGNRFNTEEECARQCRSEPAAPEVQPQPPPQAEGNICEAPQAAGDCDQYVLKWYYNAKDSRCEQFYYGGCGGNGNQFDTEADCSRRCSSEPAIDSRFGQPDVDLVPENNVAPSNTQTCFMQPEQGDCDNNQTRWYYNSAEGICDEFTYGGCGGNANNYESEDECQNQCFEVQTTCSLPATRGRCQDRMIRWYYDERQQRCSEFEFSGCRGNRNNFFTEAECMGYCNSGSSPLGAAPEPAAPDFSVCEQPVEAGECENYTSTWYYDSEMMTCTAFTYSGCGGNGNRFETKEQCDRQCGEFKGIDVCNEPVKTGPCRQWQTRFYFNKDKRSCEPFTYGGCDGTGNRFSDRSECESLCIVGQEPQSHDNRDICKLPVKMGKCTGPTQYERRWYYDDDRGTCMTFMFTGCSGNQNNFRTYESCFNYCATPPVDTNEITNNEVLPNRCESYEEECRQLRCPFGSRRVAAEGDCSRCECENPCEQYPCPEGQRCAVDISSDTNRQFVPICRDTNKPGECPHFAASGSNCVRECSTDADCRADTKCCSDGCGFVCVRPSQPTIHTTRPTTPAPVIIYPGEVKATLEPKKPQEVDVQVAVGGIAVLRCFATGSPPPNVTWSRQNVVIDTNQGRYVLTSNGDLTIVQVRQTDSGSYVCVASNGLGEPVRRELDLKVTEPKNITAYVYGDKNATQIVTLNRPAHVRCPAGGYPEPHVSWWRNRNRLGLVGNRYELTRDYSLMFRSIQLSDLGPYTCEVWNGHGRPATMKVVLKAVGPARAVNNHDAPYLQYIIDPATAPITSRPSYPYRPTRPSVVPPPPVYYEPPRRPHQSAQAVLGLDPRNSYSHGSAIAMSCSVQGYPAPDVTWTKDSMPLLSNDRIQITSEPHRLVINDATTTDSGIYGCTARNSLSYSTSEEKVIIESTVPVHPDCIDNPYFANCDLIVKGNYCRNQYYAKFCCRSCTLAGQIVQLHPNAL